MSHLIGVLIAFVNIIYLSNCQLNEYLKTTGPQGEDIWRSTTDFVPVQSVSYGTIKIGKEMDMTFDFTWGGYSYDPRGSDRQRDYENFFRIGCSAFDDNNPDTICSGGSACPGQGARYPSLWVVPELNNAGDAPNEYARHLHLSVSNSEINDCQPAMDITDWGEISVGVKYHINIWFNETIILFSMGYYSNYSRDPNTWPEVVQTIVRSSPTDEDFIGHDMPVWWMSDKVASGNFHFYNRGNGTFSNITIVSSRWPTVAPTSVPTADPTTTPTSVSPTSSPSNEPSETPTKEPTLQPSESPTTAAPSTPPTPSPTRPEGGIGGETTTSSTPSPNTDIGAEDGGGSDSGAIDGNMMIGIIVGCVGICCCLLCGFFILCKKRNKRKSSETPGKGMESEFWANHKDPNARNGANNHNKPMDIQVNGRAVPPPPPVGEAGNSPYTPLTPDGEMGPNHKVEKYLSEAQRKEMQMQTPMGPEHHSIDNVNNPNNELLDDDYQGFSNNNQAAYLSQAQKEELRKKQTPKYSSSSKVGLVDRYNVNGNDHNVIVNDSDDDVVGDMKGTAGYIGEDIDTGDALAEESEDQDQIANQNTLSNEHDDEMSQDIVDHMKTMGGDGDMIDGMEEDYDDVDEYYDPASPNAIEHKITIGADLGDGMDDEEEQDYNFVMEENVNAMNYDDVNDYHDNNNNNNNINNRIPAAGSLSNDSIYAPAHGPTLG